jgi:hypothetical protein
MRQVTDRTLRTGYKTEDRHIDEPREGYFVVRSFAAGPWIPVRVWIEDGERDPDTWELLSDQTWRAEWWPRTDSTTPYPAPFWRLLNRLYPIAPEDFEWLMLLRQLPTQSQLPKR